MESEGGYPTHIFQIWLISATTPVDCEELVEELMPVNNDNDNDNDNDNNYKSKL